MAHDNSSLFIKRRSMETRPQGVSVGPILSRAEDDSFEPIAIIGFSAMLPQDAENAQFWKMLCEGHSAETTIPKDRFNVDAFYHPDVDRIDSMNVKDLNLLNGDIAAFDAPFFSINPSEVDSMDPQQRFMLETSYRALENSGISLDTVAGSKTCVFVGSSARDYETILLRDPESPAKYIGTGIGTSMLANRISWFYNLRGPSVALDTACSSSLSALHLACQSLRDRESRMGLVGGCNLILAPDVSVIPLTRMGFFSPDGKCFSFDHRANGYAKGEGAGCIVIKLLADALEDGDTVRAVIRATGANQDGKTPGLTQPSEKAQEENIRETYHKANLDLNVTKYFESHGTGTQVGDPIEAGAINAAFQRTHDNPLYIGAVKPNIGHLEAASSIAGLIKCIRVLETGLIPPNINYEKPNIKIPLEKWHLKFPLKPTPFPTEGLRRASINSFGYGGSNTHAVLDDAFHYMQSRGITGKHNTVALPPTHEDLSQGLGIIKSTSKAKNATINGQIPNCQALQLKVFVFSASDEGGLERLATAYQAHFSSILDSQGSSANSYLSNLSYTLSNKRSNLPWKSYVLADSIGELQQDLYNKMSRPLRSSTEPAISFIFTGQGAQWAGMGRELSIYPVFYNSLSRSRLVLQKLGCEWDLTGRLQITGGYPSIDNAAVAQPLCTALQIALVDLLTSWRILPRAVTGHSSGEIAAAYCAGGLSHESAMRIAFHRGALVARLEKTGAHQGAMTAIALSESTSKDLIIEVNSQPDYGRVEIGCVNSPKSVTLTGHRKAIEVIHAAVKNKGVFAHILPISVAYHSTLMEEIAGEYLTLIQDIMPRDTLLCPDRHMKFPTVFSSVTGALLSADHLSRPEYWVSNLVSQVKFENAIRGMAHYLLETRANSMNRKDIFIEIGPTGALQRPVKDTICDMAESDGIMYDSVLKRDVSGLESCLGLIGRLWINGSKIDLAPANHSASNFSEPQLLVHLPEYPFNHANNYWTESRISKNFRMRKHARHDFLGTTVADWNPLEPKWRNTIRVKENPWILDHTIQGSDLYPAAGMIVMAIEGVRQITNPESVIAGYRIENLAFSRALVVTPAAEGVESQLLFRNHKTIREMAESYDFSIYAYLHEEWALICGGTVSVEFEMTDEKICQTSYLKRSRVIRRIEADHQNCNEVVNSTQFYRNLVPLGYGFGPNFQRLERIHYNDTGEAKANIKLDRWKQETGNFICSEHVIHPTTLDGMLQITIAALSNGSWSDIPTYVPTEAKFLWFSNQLLTSTTSEAEIYTQRTFNGYREADFLITATNTKKQPLVVIEGWQMTALSTLHSSNSKDAGLQCYSIEWKPDPALMDRDQLKSYCEKSVDCADLLSPALIDQLELLCLIFMSKTIDTAQQFDGLSQHLQKYLNWTFYRFSQSKLDRLKSQNTFGTDFLAFDSSFEHRLMTLANSYPEGALHVAVGQNLKKVLNGDVSGLDLLFSTSLAPNFYRSPSFTVSYSKIAAYVDLLAHKSPDLKILEIGAGTGAATGLILESLRSGDQKDDAPRFSEYAYTDISPSFFQGAKERFEVYSDQMTFSTLDIEKDPLDQGIEAQKYDLIVCGLVLHATTNLANTLQNTRKMLKPGGKLVLFEPSNPEVARVSFVFGLLPGWWLGTEEKRRWGPLLSDSDWHETLLENGYSGTDVCLPDYSDERHTFSVMISTALNTNIARSYPRRTVIVVDPTSPTQADLAKRITSKLQSARTTSNEICGVGEIHSKDLRSSFYIFLIETEIPFLSRMNDGDFKALKAITTCADGMLWVTKGCGESALRPEFGLATGFGRNMGSEDVNRPFVELRLELTTGVAQAVDWIVQVFNESLLSEGEKAETEYMQMDDRLCLGRVIRSSLLSRRIWEKTVQQEPKMEAFRTELQRPLELHMNSQGQLDTLHFKDDEHAIVAIAPHEVELKVQAVGLNAEDAQIALGQLRGRNLGSECAGIVTRVGESVSDLQPGDRVCCCTNTGAFKTHVRAEAIALARITENTSFVEAAALPVAFCVAYYSLIHWARLQEGELVLIYSGAEGIGQAAIQLARNCRAEVFTTVDTEESKRLLIDRYELLDDHVFVGRHGLLAAMSVWSTNGDWGVDVVFNLLGGKEREECLSYVKPFGRFIELDNSELPPHAALFAPTVSSTSVNLSSLMEKGIVIMQAAMRALQQALTTNSFNAPQPLRVYDASKIEQAFRSVHGEQILGRTIVEMLDGAIVPILPSMQPAYSFDPSATYVISGGLGGLGKSIVRWMINRHAKYFVLLSRSGANDTASSQLIEESKLRGVKIIALKCDISIEEAVHTVLEDVKHEMPPIKGCIQASMVLRDGLFQNMSLESFNASVRPKVQGSWHLHKGLPPNMDFYVLLSSITGVTGSRGQRNYACGNTYQNALARHRVSQGQRCISLDLGSILSIGFAAEKDLSAALEKDGFQGIRKDEFFALLDHCCNPSIPLPTALHSQIVTGLGGIEKMKLDRLQEVYWTRKPLFSILRQQRIAATRASSSNPNDLVSSAIDYGHLIQAAPSASAAESIVIDALCHKLAANLSIPVQDVDPEKAIYSFGIDSLVALELRNWLLKEIRADLAIFEIMQSQSVFALGKSATGKSGFRNSAEIGK